MRIIELVDRPGRLIDQFDSVAAHQLGGVRFTGGGGWTLLLLDAGGHLGRHPAVRQQLFVVVEGSGWVAGADGVRTPIQTGQAVLWDQSEEHESGTDGGMRVAVLEAAAIEVT